MTLFFLCFSLSLSAKLKVVALHPLLSDLAKNVGGERIEVIALMSALDDAHHFSPSQHQLMQVKGAKIYLASGMGLENYLHKLRDTLGQSTKLIELGKSLPKLGLCANSGCESKHHHTGVDPHWWHSIKLTKRVVEILADAFGKEDTEGAYYYKKRAMHYQERLSELDTWIRRSIIKIPKEKRKLATAHASFGYFCKEYGFEQIPLRGAHKAKRVSSAELARTILLLRKHKVKTIFPEKKENPHALKIISKETGIPLGEELDADGSASYIDMMRSNVRNILRALRAP